MNIFGTWYFIGTHEISKILFNLSFYQYLASLESKIRKCPFLGIHNCKKQQCDRVQMLSKGTFSQFLTVNFEFVHNKCADTKVQTLCGGKNAGENDGNITAAAGSQCDFSNECNVHSKHFLEVLFVFA